MPPKRKFTREDIAQAALEIVKEKGVEALTARELGKRLGTSSSPIFTVFKNMDEVKWAAREVALNEFKEYISDFKEYTPAFKRVGMMMISYAIHEPELYKLIHMQEYKKGQTFEEMVQELGGMKETCVDMIMKDYHMTQEEASLLFNHMWVYSSGIGSLCATKVCDFSEDEVAKYLGQVFAAIVMMIKHGETNNYIGQPEKGHSGTIQGRALDDFPFIKE